MNWKELEKDKKIFIAVGIPCYAFLILFFTTHYFQITVFFLMIMGIFAGGLLRKKRIWLRLSKIAFFTVIFYFLMFNNVTHLPNQFARRLPGGRNALIEPNHEKIVELRDDFYEWHLENYGEDFNDVAEGTRDELEIKVRRVDYYVRGVRMEYVYDINAPYYYYDHIPTIDEVFESDIDGDGKLQDDCDGITLITASLLLNLGYNAWIAEVEYHYHTFVYPEGADPHTVEGYEQGIYLYNSREKPAYILFNEDEVIIPPAIPIYMSIFDVLTGETMWTSYFMGFFEGDYFSVPPFVLIVLSYVICLLLAIILTQASKAGESMEQLDKKARRKEVIKLYFLNSIIISGIILLLYLVSTSGLAALGNLVFIVGLIAVFRFSDYKIGKILNE